MTGIPSEEMIGKGGHEYSIPFFGDRRPMLIDRVNTLGQETLSQDSSILESGETVISESYQPNQGPEPLYLWGTARRLYDSRGIQVGAIESIRDITHSKKTEEALKDAKEAAEAASLARSEFLANMSHEIRTPLNAVQGMIDLLLDSKLTHVQRGRVEIIKSAAEALLTLLNDILDFSKIDAGKLDFEEIDFDIRAGLTRTVSLLQLRAQDKGLDLWYSIDDEVPEFLTGDPNRIRQVLLNLANNAIKFTHVGRVAIRVDVLRRLDSEIFLHCSVADTGIGIPEEKLRSIFDRFSQADSSTTREYGGTGLGLAIAAQIAKAMGGAIWVESQVGKGSTFHFTARLQIGQPPEQPDAQFVDAADAVTDLHGMRVLLVEDNPFNQAVAVEVLHKLGCKVVLASNGKEAVRAFEQEPLDVILMDLQMPEMDGFEAVRLIRDSETKERIPIIAQTAQAFEEDRKRCFAVGMDEHIAKPIKASELARILRQYATAHGESDSPIPAPLFENSGEGADMYDPECFDFHDLLDRLEGDKDALQEMVGLFMNVTPPQLRDVKAAVTRREWEVLTRLLHSLKGACASFGACALRDITQKMEQAAKSRNTYDIDRLAEQMDREFDILVRTLARLGMHRRDDTRNPDTRSRTE